MMKRYTMVNCISIVVIGLSVAAWYFFLPDYLDARKNDLFFGEDEGAVKVEGMRTFSSSSFESKKNQHIPNISFGQLLSFPPEAPVKNPEFGETYMRASSAIAIDADTGTILHYQNGKNKMAIASLTKIMTAIVVVERIRDLKNEIVTIGKNPIYTAGTRVGCPNSGHCISNRLQQGEKISAQNLLEAMLISSANDAAVALAEHISGSEEKFAILMNDKVKEIGLSDTNFCNSSGLDIEGKQGQCYSSAYDFARITAYSLRHNLIWDIMKIKDKDVFSQDGQIKHHLISTDILLDELPNCLGGKTGFTYEAGMSLMMAAHHPTNKNSKVVAVLLDDNYRWEDMKKIFSWTFSAYTWPLPQFR